MSMVDIGRNRGERRSSAHPGAQQADQEPGLEARGDEVAWQHKMTQLHAIDYLLAPVRGIALDVHDGDIAACIDERLGLAQHTGICTRRATHMHADTHGLLRMRTGHRLMPLTTGVAWLPHETFFLSA